MAKKRKVEPLSDLLYNYFKSNGKEGKLLSARIINNWDEIVGKAAANNTKELFVDGSRLYIKIESSVLKHELNFIKEQLKDKVNDFLGRNFITELVIY